MKNIGLSATRYFVQRIPKGKTVLINLALSLFGRNYDGAIETADGRKFFIDKITSTNRTLFFLSDVDAIESELIRKIVKPGMVTFDIGANYGWYTTLLAQCTMEKGRVIAFEPAPKLVSLLRATMRLNKYDHVVIEGSAVGEHNGELNIFYSESQGTSNQNLELVNPQSTAVKTRVWSLDSYCQEHNISKIDFIKCDVDGPEMAVLKGSREILKTKPVILIEVYDQFQKLFGETGASLIRELEKMEYRCYPIGYSDNVLALPYSRLEELKSILQLSS